ncbi:hypothetical protein F5Y10DRAFT_273805 [Nemania abortiva]|nr:hypothetical protein F5Y10DRAFT_273805 [Nemania abortiva]
MPQFLPSSRGSSLQPIYIRPSWEESYGICGPTELYDLISYGPSPVPDSDHGDIHSQAGEVPRLVVVESGAKVSAPWIVEIADPNNHVRLWAQSWDFKVPDYDPSTFAHGSVELAKKRVVRV